MQVVGSAHSLISERIKNNKERISRHKGHMQMVEAEEI